MNRLMKAFVIALALGTTVAPLAAEAQNRDRREFRQDRREFREDRREFRQDRRENRRDFRRGDIDRREFRQERFRDQRDFQRDRRDFQRDRRDFRQDQRFDRNNRNWYRGRQDFRDYRGYRSGHWYAPSYGYYRVQPRYSNFRWQRGHYLPSTYRSYYVRDPYAYNLRPAPYGHRYVHAGSDIVLIAVATGLIASVLSGVY